MKTDRSSPIRASGVFGTTTLAFVSHLFGTLTCATCWAIFGPALVLVFGSGGVALLAALRPYAPLGLGISAGGLGYSFYQLASMRTGSKRLPFRLAAAFTILAAIGWTGSAAYTVVTLVRG